MVLIEAMFDVSALTDAVVVCGHAVFDISGFANAVVVFGNAVLDIPSGPQKDLFCGQPGATLGSGEQFGSLWVTLGCPWDALCDLETLWGHFEVTLGRRGSRLGDLGTFQGHFGDLIVPESCFS